MDENKREKLKELEFKILPVCGLCTQGCFKPNNDFGDCQLHTYEHKKHSAGEKPLSINRFGTCPYFELDQSKLGFLHGFAEFVEQK